MTILIKNNLHPIIWYQIIPLQSDYAISWVCRIHRLHLIYWVGTTKEYPGYDTKQFHGKAPVILELWGMQTTPTLPSLPRPLWPGVKAPDRVQSMGLKEINCVLMLNWIVWNKTVLTLKLRTYAKLNYLK